VDLERILAATEDIITPVAVVDEEVVERNLARMAKLAADNNVKLRPHAKTYKSAYMAQRRMAHGAVGLTCATFTEAEVFADAGIDDLLIAHPPAEARAPCGARQSRKAARGFPRRCRPRQIAAVQRRGALGSRRRSAADWDAAR